MSSDAHAALTPSEWYDRSIDWSARVEREIPVLMEVCGPPGGLGLLDAGCGTGHQASALAKRGYRVTGLDIDAGMLEVARRTAAREGGVVDFVTGAYAGIVTQLAREFDGVYCLANSLAAAGARDAVRVAIGQFAGCLRGGGRLFVQVLNFELMRREAPCVRGPRITRVEGVEYVSVRHFSFHLEYAVVSNITLWNDGAWRQRASSRRLYPVARDELAAWASESGLRVDHWWGGYDRHAFDPGRSADLIAVCTKG